MNQLLRFVKNVDLKKMRRKTSDESKSKFDSVQNIVLPASRIRNIGISAHIDSGKTTLTERVLFYTRKINEMHEVKTKVGPTMDFMQLERERGITIQSAATYTTWKGTNINIIDTPGHVDFTIEVERAMRVLDGAILVLCAVGGVQTQTMTVFRQMNRYNVPFIAFINKLDRMYADPLNAVINMRKKMKLNASLIHLPMGLESRFFGIIDIIREQAIYYEGHQGLTYRQAEIPKEFLSQTKDYRQELIETLSNIDEKIADRYLNDQTPLVEEINAAIRKGVINRSFVPVSLGSALKNKGIQTLLDNVVEYLPNPSEVTNFAIRQSDAQQVMLDPERSSRLPAVALAFKLESGNFGQLTYVRMYQGQIQKGNRLVNTRTGQKVRISRLVLVHANDMKEVQSITAGDIAAFFGIDCNSGDTFIDESCESLSLESMFVPNPVMSLSLEPTSTDDQMKLSKAFSKFQKEDPTFKVHTDPETREMIISGMGELHLEIYIQRLSLEYDIKVKVGKPKVSYRDTIRNVERFNYLHKKQTGGRGQFARIIGRIEPLPPAQYDFVEFIDETRGTAIPRNYIISIEKGFYEACERGHLSGHRISGVRFVIETGETHEVDSSDYAFRQATMACVKEIFLRRTGYIIEPIMSVEINVPAEYRASTTKIIDDRAGRIKDLDQNEDTATIKAEVSLFSMFGFTTSLRQVTQGKGEYSMEFLCYEEAPNERQQELINIFHPPQLDKRRKK